MRGVEWPPIKHLRHLKFLAVVPEGIIAREKITRPGKVPPVALEPKIGRLLAQVPLAHHVGGISSRAQNFGDGGATTQAGASRLVAIKPGEQGNARGMALRGIIELTESQTIGCQGI